MLAFFRSANQNIPMNQFMYPATSNTIGFGFAGFFNGKRPAQQSWYFTIFY